MRVMGGQKRDGRAGDKPDDWRTLAACTNEDPELFFPVGSSGPALLQQTQALAVCGRCPVRVECLEDMLATGSPFGVRAGFTEDDRRKYTANQLRRITDATHTPTDRSDRAVGRLEASRA